MKKLFYPITILLAFAFTFTACGSDDEEEPLLPPGARIYLRSSQSYSHEPFKSIIITAYGVEEYGIEHTEWILEHQRATGNSPEFAQFVHYRLGSHLVKANFYKRGQLAATDSIYVNVKQPTEGFMGINLYGYQNRDIQFINDTIQLDLLQDKETYRIRLYCTVKPQFASIFNVRTFFDNMITAIYGEKRDTDAEETGYLIEESDYLHMKFVLKADEKLVDIWWKKTCSVYTIKSPEKGYYLYVSR